MSEQALQALERAIDALTVDEIERTDIDDAGQRTTTLGRDIALLNRSIGIDLGAVPSMPDDQERPARRGGGGGDRHGRARADGTGTAAR